MALQKNGMLMITIESHNLAKTESLGLALLYVKESSITISFLTVDNLVAKQYLDILSNP